jgi:hypothetical protein
MFNRSSENFDKAGRSMSGNVKEFLLHFVISFKADVATGIETLHSNFKNENTKMAEDISSRTTSQLTKKFQAETENFERTDGKISCRDR